MKQLCIAGLILMLAACAHSHGTKIDAGQLSALTIGQTKITDVEDQFGPPTGITITSEGITTLTYNYVPPAKADAFFLFEAATIDDSDRKQTVSLVFDPDGRLKSYNQTIAPPDKTDRKP